MRAILFRGQDIDTKEWVYGYYIKHLPYTPSPIRTQEDDEKIEEDYEHYIINDEFSDWAMPRNTVNIQVIPSTVGQYTGLEDKKGVKIFEGDIVKFFRTMKFLTGDKYTAQVIFSQCCFMDNYWHENIWWHGQNEVIGNIHEKAKS